MPRVRNVVNIDFIGTTTGLTKSLVKSQIALRGIENSIRFVTEGFKQSFDAVEKFNTLIASQAGILTSIQQPRIGENIKQQFERSLDVVKDMNEFFIDINKNTLATFEQMSIVNRELLKTGVILDTNNKKQVEGFESFVNAIAIFTAGMPDQMNQFRQEANAVLNGVSGKGRDVANFLKSVFGETWKDQIELMKEQGTLLENFGEIFKGFKGDIDALTNTWQVQGTTLNTVARDILRRGFEDTYIKIIELVKELNEHLMVHRDEYAEKISDFWDGIAGSIALAVDSAKKFNNVLSMFKDNSFLKELATFTKVFHAPHLRAFEAVGSLMSLAGKSQKSKVTPGISDMPMMPTGDTIPPGNILGILPPEDTTTKKTEDQRLSKYKDFLDRIWEVTKSDHDAHIDEYKLMNAQKFWWADETAMDSHVELFKENLEEFNDIYEPWVDALKRPMSEVIDEWIAGTLRFEDAIQQMTQGILDTFRAMIADMIAQWLAFEAVAIGLDILAPGSGQGIRAVRKSRMGFATGTDELPFDMTANVHKGETIVPAREAEFLRSGKLALVSASEAMQNNSTGSDAMLSRIEDLATRPIYNVIDFGESQMIEFTRQQNKVDYIRREAVM